jgi:riboflavin kinase/FMN adenylyltransferase
MQLIRNLSQIINQLPETCLTIGNFDGLHLAHQKIIEFTKQIATKKGLKSAILSFEPHPISFLNRQNHDFNHNFRISNLSNKIKYIKNHNIDYLLVIPFNNYLSNLSPKLFIDNILINKINAKSLVVGYDFTFGKKRQGNFKTLEEYNFDLHEINPIKIIIDGHEKTISSSLARQYIQSGEVKKLPPILGRNFSVDGLVISGKKLARELGYPTANFLPRKDIINLKFGVYKTRTFIYKYHKYFDSITNFGIKPTFENNFQPLFENHILNFSQDIYNHKILVEFLDFIREEQKFSSIDELKNQIKKDLIF